MSRFMWSSWKSWSIEAWYDKSFKVRKLKSKFARGIQMLENLGSLTRIFPTTRISLSRHPSIYFSFFGIKLREICIKGANNQSISNVSPRNDTLYVSTFRWDIFCQVFFFNFWTSGDVSSGFQSHSGQPYSRTC